MFYPRISCRGFASNAHDISKCGFSDRLSASMKNAEAIEKNAPARAILKANDVARMSLSETENVLVVTVFSRSSSKKL